MGFTIEDMLVVSREKYKMQVLAGGNGWSNSISWILMIEDSVVLRNFKGKDLAVTTGFGFDTESKLFRLVEKLISLHASGLIINTGRYIHEIPDSVIEICNENDFPLLTVPWDIMLFDMIKNLSLRVLLQNEADAQISNAFIRMIESPETAKESMKELLAYFDVDGTFQIVLISTGDLDSMDTVERRRLEYRLQLYLENLSHNGHLFYYAGNFVLIVNALSETELDEILKGFLRRAKRKLIEQKMSVGVGSVVIGVENLQKGYKRANAAIEKALQTKKDIIYFDKMGIYRLFGMVSDPELLVEMGRDVLKPLIDHDEKHDADYVETLKLYLENNGSIQAVADQMYTHRNTVIYRVNNIKKMLDSSLDSPDERLKYQIACLLCSRQVPS